MANLLIINEKPSQMKNFAKALGGMSGDFNGNHYDLVCARGHLLAIKDPQDMVSDPQAKEKLSDWKALGYMPWPVEKFNWSKQLIPNDKSAKSYFTNIKKHLPGHDVVVIATDDDPSGEGDLLGWEIINHAGYKGQVWRIRFKTEVPKHIKQALSNPENATDQEKQPKYIQGKTRQRFDYAVGLCETRLITGYAQKEGFSYPVLNAGRLKTVIVSLVNEQNLKIKNYKKQPYYEIRYKDNAGNVYSKKDAERFSDKSEAESKLTSFDQEDIVMESKEVKEQEPPLLINLAEIGTIVQKKGFKLKTIKDTYQSMYTDGVVSYPRTSDKKIEKADFDEILPYAGQIAKVVGVDSSLLTHTAPRAKFLTDHADHGANRPDKNVPISLNDIENKYGKCGVEIYLAVAKSYLAMLCENYTYYQIKGHLKAKPDYKTTLNISKDENYKLVFDKEKKEENTPKALGIQAKPFVYEGTNPKPAKPTMKFIVKFLMKNNIGTGATQSDAIQTLSEESKQIKLVKGAYEVTGKGAVVAALSKGTWLAEARITKRLQTLLDQLTTGESTYSQILQISKQIVEHDKAVIANNAQSLKEDYQVKELAMNQDYEETFTGKFAPTGTEKTVKVRIPVDGHKTTTSEQELALLGKTISYKVKQGDQYLEHEAHLGEHVWKNKAGKEIKSFGWIVKFPEPDLSDKISINFKDGKTYHIKKSWRDHVWTTEEIEKISQGESVIVKLTSKAGKEYRIKAIPNPKSKIKGKNFTFFGFDTEFVN